ncbi:MAG: hypothetical protein ACLFSQ_10910 [Candidatus Zixiibacteriota bacterium]
MSKRKFTITLMLATMIVMMASCNVNGTGSSPSEVAEDNTLIIDNPDTSIVDRDGKAMIKIEGFGEFQFYPNAVERVRPDLFREGHFSVFAALKHIAEQNSEIDLKYHYDSYTKTHMIDNLNGDNNWWYIAFYSGGWSERNSFRMDHFPYKDDMYIKIYQVERSALRDNFRHFENEVETIAENDGKIILPQVTIDGPSTDLYFTDVELTAHNLRDDMFQEDVITAIDVIMSLGDQGKLQYDTTWYESIGSAEIVKNYFISQIDDDVHNGRCDFVYECGKAGLHNHIHIPSDTRVIVSPEYISWFWICL